MSEKRPFYLGLYLHSHSLKKSSSKELEKKGGRRQTCAKILPAEVNHPFGLKKGIGTLLALNFLHERERFAFPEFFNALKRELPLLEVVEESLLTFPQKKGLFFFYFEMTKKGGELFSLKERKKIYLQLQKEVKENIIRWIRHLFMPRNEEEIARFLMVLKKQVKTHSDIPHIVLQFDRQTEKNLIYTAVCVRIRGREEKSLDKVLKIKKQTSFNLERYRHLGNVGFSHVKEGVLFQIYLPIQKLIRHDQTLDVYKGRKLALSQIENCLGEVRDYNGGMIAKQEENLKKIKEELPSSVEKEALLEQFFHSIYPFEQKSILPPKLLRHSYLILQKVIEKEARFFCQNKEGTLFAVMRVEKELKEKSDDISSEMECDPFSSPFLRSSLRWCYFPFSESRRESPSKARASSSCKIPHNFRDLPEYST